MASDAGSIQKIHHIVVGYDFSELADRALYDALDFAAHRTPVELHVVVVAQQAGTMPQRGLMLLLPDDDTPMTEAEAREKVRARIAKAHEEHHQNSGVAGVDRISVYVLPGVSTGQTGHAIAELAKEIDAELIVVGSHGRRGLNRLLLGSVAEKVVREATASVYVVRPQDFVGGTKVPSIEPPLAEGQPHLRHFQHRHTYHFPDKAAESTQHTMPAT
ncbi:MAG TPA: universal stress protein [Polyangiaceae bacterium]|nr:universal stress protein [Polyangiaceae bacterium]